MKQGGIETKTFRNLLVEVLKDLEVDSVCNEQFQGKEKFCVAQVRGYNLSLNSVLGYTEGVSVNSVCRWCCAQNMCIAKNR